MSLTLKKMRGNFGEEKVAKFLIKNKFKIIKRNYNCKFGEIDIIAENKDLIIFVEVKTRNFTQIVAPQFSVDYKKQKRIMMTAHNFLTEYKSSKQPRFDVAEVIIDSLNNFSINYIDNAFQQESDYAVF